MEEPIFNEHNVYKLSLASFNNTDSFKLYLGLTIKPTTLGLNVPHNRKREYND